MRGKKKEDENFDLSEEKQESVDLRVMRTMERRIKVQHEGGEESEDEIIVNPEEIYIEDKETPLENFDKLPHHQLSFF